MDKITKITGVYPIQLTHTTGPEVHIACQGEEIGRALNELRERVCVLENQVNDLTKSHNELQANYWETETKIYNVEDVLSKININLRDNEGNFRSTEAVLNDLSNKWDELDDVQQFATKQAIVGTRNQLLGPDTSIATVKPKQKSDLEIFNQNLQELLSNVGISAQEAYTALGELTDWIKEDKKWY